MKSWKELALGAGLTVVAAFAGSYFADYWQQQQWKRNTNYGLQQEAIAARRKIITRVSDVLVDGTIFALRHAANPNDDKNPVSQSLYCLEEPNRNSAMCRARSSDATHKSFIDEFLPMHRVFLQVATEVRLYFCAQSISVFERLPQGYWWWSAPEARKREIVTHLEADIDCRSAGGRASA